MEQNQMGVFNWLPAALGCLLLAAIFSVGCMILLSRLARSQGLKRGRFLFNPWFNVLGGVVVFSGLLTVFYTVENWRGRHAWEECRLDLETGGAVLDWSKYIQPLVPDDQNFFKAPKMAEWFGGYYGEPKPGNDPARRSEQHQLAQVKLADLVVVPFLPNTNAGDADVVLQYDSFDPALFELSTNDVPRAMQFQDVPITIAIESLARMVGIQYVLDPKISRMWPGSRNERSIGRQGGRFATGHCAIPVFTDTA